eukprot:TRINITY_DN3614_c0_g1_i2.p1 TRINITY_DN3614_c0_g1~~TRINITY_DN3614_c0_g1_i2.p1  ORF type:complete len:174 (-),score=24.76 TRINITY_DN3614_c0_g1_i2:144-665(-)
MVNISIGMTLGLEHLHANNVIHRDVAPRNFLISEEDRIKVTDFGMSRSIAESEEGEYIAHISSSFAWRWCPLETLTERNSTKATDSWMLGCSIWQVISGKKKPFEKSKSLAAHAINLQKGMQHEFSSSCHLVLRDVVNNLCTTDPENRWTMTQTVEFLRTFTKESENISSNKV